MFVKLTVLACVATVALAQWGGHNGGWNGNQNALDSGAYTGDGDYHGEGLQEAGAYGDVSQNWNDNNNGQQWNAGNDGQWNNGANNGQWNGGNNGQWNGGNNGQWNAGQNGGWNGGQNGGWNGGNNGQWNGNNAGWNGGGHAQAALLPAGVDASACPNYPFCH